MKKIQTATLVEIADDDRRVLEVRSRSATVSHRLRQRARIVLLCAEGLASRVVARKVGCTPGTASRWRVRYANLGLAGLEDRPRAGKAPVYTLETDRRILAELDKPPPKGYGRWSGPLLAAALADVSDQYIWRFLRAQKIDLAGRKSWCVSTDPEFAAKAADIVGLYLAPPENAIVLAVDEKPSIQALERAQGYLKLSGGKTLTGYSHTYKRHGTTTLFAALNVATGQVHATHSKRRRRKEFLAFMNDIVDSYPDQEIHVILDNLNTHKPKTDRWLSRRKNVHFHFTPTSASWLNQVEIWFSILAGQSLKGASFTAVKQLRDHISAFIESYNEQATPFCWKKTTVSQKGMTKCLTD